MKRVIFLGIIAAVVACAAGCGDPVGEAEFDLDAARASIEATNRAFTRAHVTGEVEIINAYFAKDAKIFLPGAAWVTGAENIAALNEEYVAYGIAAFEETTTALYGGPDLLVEEGLYSMTYGPEATVEHGKYVNVWVPEDGTWKVRANIWNANGAAGP